MPPVIDWQFLLRVPAGRVSTAGSYWAGDLSAEITAIATAMLAAFAIITAVFAFLAYRRQSQEVNVLQQQLKDQLEATARQAASELQAKQQPMAQASQVFIVHLPMAGKDNNYMIVNTSEQPIYDVKVLFPRDSSGKWVAQGIGIILPGATIDTELIEYTNVALRFRDAAKSRWLRMSGGDLIEEMDVTPPGRGVTYRFTDLP